MHLNRSSLDTERIVILGSRGYIGSVLASTLKEAGISCTRIDMRGRIDGHITLNLSDHEATRVLLRDLRPTLLLHCGTHSALAYRENFFTSFQQDFDALHSLVSALHDLPLCRVVYFSSSYVYSGLPRDVKVTENSMLLPKHHFGVGKMFFEQYLLRNHGESIVFRLSSVFGEGQSQHPNAILALAQEAQGTGKITIWGAGTRMMQYVYLPDVVRVVFSGRALPAGIYNLGGEEYSSVADVASQIARFFGVPCVFLKDKTEGETLPFMLLGKIRAVVPQEKFTPLESALEVYLHKALHKAKNQNAKVKT
ncbi:MAG: hypothetical protein G01um101448_118 [Parcubacteria group bacterium Gr01-1014_48]|nr:MAG: hypothetical protein G01um101448_118 [Parcubacteria group bacterium Gr01-1014_48]TSD01788.1 MAG: hypothetical protein Greene101415_46 [Parcubacteria group bacterium Greene1014_15]